MAARQWRKWVRVQDYREAAEQSEKLAEKFLEIRRLTLFRWKVTGAVALATAAGGAVVYAVYGTPGLWVAAGLIAATLAVFGRRNDGAAGRKPVLAGPRTLAWTMDSQLLVDAFRDTRLIGKDESLRLVERAVHDGTGWAVTVDLPATRKAADVIKHREALASALAVDEVQLVLERVRGRSGHAGRVALWVADRDPYASAPQRFPLLDAHSWNAWQPVPFGRDARQRPVELQLVWTSLIVGAIPRQGKTCATRLPASGLVLDPHARLYIFDGKGGKDWRATEAVAHRYVCGDEQQHVEAVREHLAELVATTQDRYRYMSTLDDEVCPESKITPELSRDRDVDMPITAVILDEVQVYLENTTRLTVEGKSTTLGENIADLLTYLARKGPAAGITVLLATQRPDTNTIPPRLRAVLGSRFALRVMDWRDSNIVLGEQMNTRGFDASTLLPSHKGVGILRPDGDAETGPETAAVTARTYYMDNAEWRALCQRGRALRQAAGTLTGHAAGEETPHTADQERITDTSSSGDDAEYAVPADLPEPLASVVAHLGAELTHREFVPTTELTETLDLEPTTFGRAMNRLGCHSTRQRMPDADGEVRRVRGYLTADLRAAIDRNARAESSSHDDAGEAGEP